MKDQPVVRDERTIAVENAGYRFAYLLLSFGLLAIVAYRSLVTGESSWDLLALVLVSGFVTTVHSGLHKILCWRWALVAVMTGLAAAVVAVAIALSR